MTINSDNEINSVISYIPKFGIMNSTFTLLSVLSNTFITIPFFFLNSSAV